MTRRRKFARTIDSLEKMFDFSGAFARRHGFDETAAYGMQLVLEELFTNIIKYGRDDGGEVAIELAIEKGWLVIRVTDDDADPYDITQHHDVDISGDVDDREAGGLGIHLVRSMMDDVTYEHDGRRARITVRKRLGGNDV